MKKLSLLFGLILLAIGLPWLLAYQIPQLRRYDILISFLLVTGVAAAGVIWLWRSEDAAPEAPTLIKLALYTGVLLLFRPLRIFALSFYPLALIIPIVLGLLLLFARTPSAPAWLRVEVLQQWTFTSLSFLLANALVLGATVLFAPPAVPIADSPDKQVTDMAQMDQDDRMTGRILLAPNRDAQRVEQVTQMVAQEELGGPEAWLAAALILQHGQCPRHFRMAYALARQAYEAGAADAEGMMQAAYDRWQLSLGHPQKYGTQPDFQPGEGACAEQ